MARKPGTPPCAFCGNARTTRTRVLPAWLDACFPDSPPVTAERAIACRACSHGWLARLEDVARPIVEPLVTGRPILLDLHNQRTIALWGAKTILTLQSIRDPALVPIAACRELLAERRPPTGFRIAIAPRPREGRWPYRYAALSSEATLRAWDVEPTFPETPLGDYRAEFCVGHLVLRAAANFTPHAMPIEHGSASIEIWPARAPVRWPPALGLVRSERVAA